MVKGKYCHFPEEELQKDCNPRETNAPVSPEDGFPVLGEGIVPWTNKFIDEGALLLLSTGSSRDWSVQRNPCLELRSFLWHFREVVKRKEKWFKASVRKKWFISLNTYLTKLT